VGDLIAVKAKKLTLDHEPEAIPLQVEWEDEELLIVNKPAGLVVHPGAGQPSGTLMNGLLHHIPEASQLPRAGIVHRLDKDTSGLLIVAKTAQTQLALIRKLAKRVIKREYRALVIGRPAPHGTVEAAIGRHPVHRTKMAVVDGGRFAVTHFERLHAWERISLLACRLETGRTHQIRVHMQHLGHPILGDTTYMSRRAVKASETSWIDRQALHARRLTFDHPVTNKTIVVEAAMPDDMSSVIDRLRVSESS
ncbi:MAG: RluA family pseudouridine synthase, partial [Gammaproteobacteria bacterium]